MNLESKIAKNFESYQPYWGHLMAYRLASQVSQALNMSQIYKTEDDDPEKRENNEEETNDMIGEDAAEAATQQ